MVNAYIDGFQIHSNTFNPNGIYLRSPVKGLDSPQVRYSGQDRIGASGHLAIGQKYGARLLPWEGYIANDDATNYYQYRRQFMELISALTDSHGDPILKTLTFTMPDGKSYQMDVLLNGKPELPHDNPLFADFYLPLLSPEPQIFEQGLVTTSPITRPIGTGLHMPAHMPAHMGTSSGGSIVATNQGTMYTYPVVFLQGVHTNPLIYNEANAKSFGLQYVSQSTDEIVIDMLNQTVTLNNRESLINAPTDTSEWFWLEKGSNPIRFSSGSNSDAGVMFLRYYHAYVGV